MGRPGRLGLRNGLVSGNIQISFCNYIAKILSIELAEKIKKEETKKEKKPIFDKTGHITLESISERREFFLGKSVHRIEHELNKYGYKTDIHESKYEDSRAVIITILNTSKNRNISQIQVSPGSKRHGNVPYIKISTIDIGKIKIIDSKETEYKKGNAESAILLFRRK